MKRWTKTEESILLQGIGPNSIDWLCRKLKKSRAAIDSKLYRMFGGGISRGTYSLSELMSLTGYGRSQILRARKALKQKWKRTSTKGHFLITDDQLEEIGAWLGLDYWSKPHRLYKCLWCGKAEYCHKSYGLCTKCYLEYARLLHKLDFPMAISKLIDKVSHAYTDTLLKKSMYNLERNRAIPKEALMSLL